MSAFAVLSFMSSTRSGTGKQGKLVKPRCAIAGFGPAPGDRAGRPKFPDARLPVPKTPIFIVFSDS